MTGAWHSFVDRVLLFSGSTRGVALMRIAFAALLWREYARKLIVPSVVGHTDLTLIALVFWPATLCMFIGLWSRTATCVCGLTALFMYHYLGVYQGADFYVHHHSWLLDMMPVLLSATACGGSLSVDRWLALRRAERDGTEPPAERGTLWGTRLIIFQMFTIYWWTAYDKTRPAFPERLEHMFAGYWWGSDLPPFPGFSAVVIAIALFVVLAEWWIPVGLLFRRTRLFTLAVGFVLHVGIFLGLPVGTFTGTMFVAYLAFIPPEDVHRWVDRMLGVRPTDPAA